jgi:hypothetical protein
MACICFDDKARQLLAMGHPAIPVLPGAKYPIVDGWPQYGFKPPSLALLDQWVERWPYSSWGVPCERIIGIDLDDDHPRRAKRLRKLVLLALGLTRVQRIGRPNRVMLIYATVEPIETERIHDVIEVLAGGAQFVAYGIHPDTGQPYTWPDLELTDVPLADLPLITQAQIDALLVRIRRIYKRQHNPWQHNRAPRSWTIGPDGKVVDGREEFLRHCVMEAWLEAPNLSVDGLAAMAWQRFATQAELSRPKSNRKGQWSIRDATIKARHTLRRAAAGRLRHNRLISGIPPARVARPVLPLRAAETAVGTEVFAHLEMAWDAIFNEQPRPPPWLLAAMPGLGKTRAALQGIRYLMQARDRYPWQPVVWYAVPSYKLASELAIHYGRGAYAIRGRTHRSKQAPEPLCARWDVVNKAIAAGITDISSTFCHAKDKETGTELLCPHRIGCAYFEQFETAKQGRVIFLAQDYLFVEMDDKLLPRPNVVVIDESILNAAMVLSDRITPEALLASAGGPNNNPAAVWIDALLEHLKDGTDPRPDFRDNMQVIGTDPHLNGGKVRSPADMLRYTAESAGGGAARREIKPGMSDAEIETALENVRSAHATGILRRLADELDVERPGVYSVYLDPAARIKATTGEWVTAPFVYMQWRRKLRLPRKAVVLILDGTAEPELLRAIWPDLNVTTVTVARNAYVVQSCGYTASMQKMLGSDADAAAAGGMLADLCKRLPAPGLLVTYKDLPVELPDGWARENLGNLRGTDDHGDRTTVVVAGRLQITALDAERRARALYYDQAVPLDVGRRRPDPRGKDGQITVRYDKPAVGYRMRNGELWGVETWRHADPRVDLIRAATAEREVEQAVDRLRLVRRGSPALVVLVNETPTDLPVDALVSWGRLRSDRLTTAMLRLGGVVPMVPSWLAQQCPELWPTAKAAEREIEQRTSDSGYAASLLLAAAYTWRPKRRRGGPASLVWSLLPEAATRARLAEWFGPLGLFELLL